MLYTVGSNKKIYLDFAPKQGTLVVKDFTIVVHPTAPSNSSQVGIRWATESYASNVLTFHSSLPLNTQVEVTYAPYLFLLKNLDPNRTSTRTEVKKVEVNGKIKLDGIPKKDSVSIPGISVVSTDTQNFYEPNSTQAAVTWADDYNYITSTGELTFNAINIGAEYEVTYVPIGSRVDADIINKFIEFHNELSGETWTKTELADNTTGEIVHWENLIGRPGLVSSDSAGLMTSEQFILLSGMDSDLPIGAIKAGDTSTSVPDSWGGGIELQNTDTVTTTVVNNKLQFDVVQSKFTQLTASTTAALNGTAGIPSTTNKFVTSSDTRLTDARVPQTHNQTFDTVLSEIDNPIQPAKNLTNALAGKSPLGHTHIVSNITDFPTAVIPTADEKAAISGGTGANPFVKSNDPRLLVTFAHTPISHNHSIPEVINLSAEIEARSMVGHKHSVSDIPGLGSALLTSDMLRTKNLIDDYIVEGLTTSTTGVRWDRVSSITKWAANTVYTVNSLVYPTTLNGKIYRVNKAGTSSATEPTTWNTLAIINDGENLIFEYYADVSVWAANTDYSFGTNVFSTSTNPAYYYTCSYPGRSFSSAPTWLATTTTEVIPSFYATKDVGMAYAGGMYTEVMQGTPGRSFKYVGGITNAVQTSGTNPTGLKRCYPINVARKSVQQDYDIKVTVANSSADSMVGLRTQWRVAPAGGWSADIVYLDALSTVDANIDYALDTAQYSVGDQWRLTASLDCDWYDYLGSDSQITHIAVAHGEAVPATPEDAVILCKVVTNGSTVSGVTDLRNTSVAINFGSTIKLRYSADYPDTLMINGTPIITGTVVDSGQDCVINAIVFGG